MFSVKKESKFFVLILDAKALLLAKSWLRSNNVVFWISNSGQQWEESVAQKIDKKNKPKVLNWWSKRYFVTLLFPLFYSCMMLQIRLPWNNLIHNGSRNMNSSYMNNKCQKITCTSMERTNSKTILNSN